MTQKSILFEHDKHFGYPDKVYDYVIGYLINCPQVKMKTLQHDVQYYKGYRVPLGTLSSWCYKVRTLGRIPRKAYRE